MAHPGARTHRRNLTIKAKEGDFLVLEHDRLSSIWGGCSSTRSSWPESRGRLIAATTPKTVDLDKLIGTRRRRVSMKIDGQDDALLPRLRHARQARRERWAATTIYTITLRPWLWFADARRTARSSRRRASRRSSGRSSQDYSSRRRVASSPARYPKLDYCVQYDETDFDFVSRLIEEDGIYYYFEHEDGEAHAGADRRDAKHEAYRTSDTIKWAQRPERRSRRSRLVHPAGGRAARRVLTEYDYLDSGDRDRGRDVKSERAEHERLGKMEWFEHPGRVVQNRAKPDAQPAADAAKQRGEGADGGAARAATRRPPALTNVRDLARRHDLRHRGRAERWRQRPLT